MVLICCGYNSRSCFLYGNCIMVITCDLAMCGWLFCVVGYKSGSCSLYACLFIAGISPESKHGNVNTLNNTEQHNVIMMASKLQIINTMLEANQEVFFSTPVILKTTNYQEFFHVKKSCGLYVSYCPVLSPVSGGPRPLCSHILCFL